VNFETFIKLNLRNEWLQEYRSLRLYVRKTPEGFKDKWGDYQLASMTSNIPGSGLLTRFLNRYEKKYQFYIENILNPRLITFFEKRGYKVVNDPLKQGSPCMMGPKPKEKKNG
jgi:hypothetical protein